jgi:hypothetical protein
MTGRYAAPQQHVIAGRERGIEAAELQKDVTADHDGAGPELQGIGQGEQAVFEHLRARNQRWSDSLRSTTLGPGTVQMLGASGPHEVGLALEHGKLTRELFRPPGIGIQKRDPTAAGGGNAGVARRRRTGISPGGGGGCADP